MDGQVGARGVSPAKEVGCAIASISVPRVGGCTDSGMRRFRVRARVHPGCGCYRAS